MMFKLKLILIFLLFTSNLSAQLDLNDRYLSDLMLIKQSNGEQSITFIENTKHTNWGSYIKRTFEIKNNEVKLLSNEGLYMYEQFGPQLQFFKGYIDTNPNPHFGSCAIGESYVQYITDKNEWSGFAIPSPNYDLSGVGGNRFIDSKTDSVLYYSSEIANFTIRIPYAYLLRGKLNGGLLDDEFLKPDSAAMYFSDSTYVPFLINAHLENTDLPFVFFDRPKNRLFRTNDRLTEKVDLVQSSDFLNKMITAQSGKFGFVQTMMNPRKGYDGLIKFDLTTNSIVWRDSTITHISIDEKQDSLIYLARKIDEVEFSIEKYKAELGSFEEVARVQNLVTDLKVVDAQVYILTTKNAFVLTETGLKSLHDITVSIDTNEMEMSTFSLNEAYPNPFNPTTTITFSLQKTSKTTLTLFNLLGQKVETLMNQKLASGTYSTTVDARHLSSGVYIVQLQTESGIKSTKITLIK